MTQANPLSETVSATATPILLVTAQDDWGSSLVQYFHRNGYAVHRTRLVTEALHRLREQCPSCLLVDRAMVNWDALRSAATDLRIPLATVQVGPQDCPEEDCLADYAAGIDAVLCTSSQRELLARIRALLRREEFARVTPKHYCAHDIDMDIARHEVRVRGLLVELTPKEFQLLECLLAAPHHVFTRQELMDHVWGEDYALEPHGVDVHISALRRKVEQDPARPQTILTVRGRGYKVRVNE